ncbi:hypothetical protein B2G71_15875 [Novosphingobium sp. PC22D]|uniref:DUF58 domain-containing protein n=1 Tax=Novosphingobium sp. PC22D TaxID=1962403 RepID=UPI000BF1B891|nr:DUF58 domain-containing protein [Novosphingobium sp. PC22D]PEQ11603.1 hypothetical protein B2G71_15875 [Novosphingobium sp. PC22D]
MARRLALVPTIRAAVLLALAAPVALLLGAVAPGAWIAAPALCAVLLGLILLDALLAGSCEAFHIVVPGDVEVGAPETIVAQAQFARGRRSRAEAVIACDPRLAPGGRLALATVLAKGSARGEREVRPNRRGTARIARAWLRWDGPLGLGARQIAREPDIEVRIWPNVGDVRSPALQTYLRDAQFGLIARRIRGEGTQFEALAEYQPGMDRRRIDWKASARHLHLYAKENETERNNQIVFAFDCGQAMCEPIAGMPRLDRAVTAALTTAYVALKGGDRVSLFGFAARPLLSSPFVAAPRDFHRLQRAAASLDYRSEEPNFTLALASLAGQLQRRSLVVVFSDFTDPTSAELMIESVSRLVSRHLVLFVTMVDEELEAISAERPGDISALSMAVSADLLLRQRALVTRRLRQLGVDVIEAPHHLVGTRLIDAYLAIKRSGALG